MLKRCGFCFGTRLRGFMDSDAGWRESKSVKTAIGLLGLITSNALSSTEYQGPDALRDFFVSSHREGRMLKWAFEAATRMEVYAEFFSHSFHHITVSIEFFPPGRSIFLFRIRIHLNDVGCLGVTCDAAESAPK